MVMKFSLLVHILEIFEKVRSQFSPLAIHWFSDETNSSLPYDLWHINRKAVILVKNQNLYGSAVASVHSTSMRNLAVAD